MTTTLARLGSGLVFSACALVLAGCNTGPTYGTGVSQSQQLFQDVDGLLTLGSTNRQEISYAPRPELVRPASIGTLPPPRQAMNGSQDPNWPQSPEVLRERQRAAAEATRGEGALPADYNPSTGRLAGLLGARPTDRQAQDASWMSPEELRAGGQQAAQARAEQVSVPTQRRYLSEPPVEYRQPAATAPAGDTGVDEEVKQRRAQGTRSLGSRIRDSLPF